MEKARKQSTSGRRRKMRPALDPDARENQLISLATDVAEQQLLDGTASAQVITHYLKLGTAKARLEKKMLEEQVELIKAKTQSYRSMEETEAAIKEAVAAMKRYQGSAFDDSEEVYDDQNF